MIKRINYRKLEYWIIILIALHSIGIGTGLLWSPGWAYSFAGWEIPSPIFFPHQGGVFHIVLAIAYLIEYFRYRGVILLFTAKTIAVLFILVSTIFGNVSYVVPLFGAIDAIMGIVVFLVHRNAIKYY